jgi:hypothetical protein
VAAALAIMTAAFVMTKTGRDALFFQGRGVYELPRAYIGIAVASLPMAGVVLGLMRMLGARAARVVAPVLAAIVLAAFVPVAHPGGGTAMTVLFLYVPLVFGVLFSLSWLLAADLLDQAPRGTLARAYGIIGAASMGGGIAGGLAAGLLADQLGARHLLSAGAAGLLLSALVMARAHARYPAMHPPLEDAAAGARLALPSALRVVRRPYALALLGTGMLAALAGVLVEFQFYLAAATSGRGTADQVRFFSGFYVFLNAIALAVQIVVLPRMSRSLGRSSGLLVLPIAVLGGASILLASASFVARSALRIAEGGLKSSIHRASWEQAFVPLGAAERAVAKLLVDGAGARIAEGLAASAVWVWLHLIVRDGDLVGRDIQWVTWTLLGCTILWFVLTRSLGRHMPVRVDPADYRPEVLLPDT